MKYTTILLLLLMRQDTMNRDYVIPSDVKDVVHMVLAHRIILNYDAKMKEMSAYSLLDDILDHIREPGIE